MSTSQPYHSRHGLWAVALCLFCLLFGACRESSDELNSSKPLPSLHKEIQQARSAISPDALAYLEAALDTIETYHAIGTAYDWEEWRLIVLERARGANVPAESYEALTFALEDLKDRHRSFRRPPSGDSKKRNPDRQPEQGVSASIDLLHAEVLEDQIAIVFLPFFLQQDTESANKFVLELQRLIRTIDAQPPCGWIIDLRRNKGGNMWAMIAGIGPVLGEGHIGSVASRVGITEAWYYLDGEARLDTLVLASIDEPYTLKRPLSPVAVLIGSKTASSGEAVVVAFRGRVETKFFGSATAGATSSPSFFELKDGAVLGFATTFMADRHGTIYDGPIEPDVSIEGDYWDEPDRVREAAVDWLKTHVSCRASQ